MNNELSAGCYKVSIMFYLLFFNALCYLVLNIGNYELDDVLLYCDIEAKIENTNNLLSKGIKVIEVKLFLMVNRK